MNNDVTIRTATAAGGKEIKASAHYSYIERGITLDGSKFALNELVTEGQCLVKDNTTGLYEKAGADLTGKSSPVILDESVKFKATDGGTNPNVTAGQVLVHGAVYTSMLTNCTAAFKTAMAAQGVRFVE